MGLREPGMAIDARTLVIPPFVERGIYAQSNDILTPVNSVIRYIEAEGRIAAEVPPQIEAVKEDDGIAKDPIEVERDAPSFIRCGQGERSFVPTDARCRELPPQSLAAVGSVNESVRSLDRDKRQLDCPIVREVDNAPGAVVETVLQRLIPWVVKPILAGFRKGPFAGGCAPAKVFRCVIRISKMKAPSEIEQQFFTRRGCISRSLVGTR